MDYFTKDATIIAIPSNPNKYPDRQNKLSGKNSHSFDQFLALSGIMEMINPIKIINVPIAIRRILVISIGF